MESKIRHFDLEKAGISPENIACWIMVETVKLGYPGYKEYALQTDQLISGEFGTGRGRNGYAERLGKKYYWILLHRLIGLLSDNVSPKLPSSDRTSSHEHLWSVLVRKVDLTDVRDISPSREYPEDVLKGPRYAFPDTTSDVRLWVSTEDFTPHHDCIVRSCRADTEWVALSFSARDNDRSPGNDSWRDPYLGVDLIYTSVFVAGSIPSLERGGILGDAFDSEGTSCYRSYLAEYPDSPVFDQLAGDGYFYQGPRNTEFSEVTLLRGGEWEYDYSHTTPERQDHLRVPCRDIVRMLNLRWDGQRGWIDSAGELMAFEALAKGRNGLFIRRDVLNKYLSSTRRKLVYQRFATRGLFSSHDHDNPKIDLFTWLLYRPKGPPKVLKQDVRSYSCGDGPLSDNKGVWPFSSVTRS